MLERRESEVSVLATEICGAVSEAIERYAFISDSDESLMPEHFVAAYVCNNLGDKYYIVMEAISSKLNRWNKDARERLPQLPEVLAKLKASAQIKPDLVFFRRTDSSFLCMLEMKRDRNNWDSDVQKIEEFLPNLDTCPWGIVASYCCVSDGEGCLREYERRANHRKHAFVMAEKARMHEHSYVPFAEIIPNRTPP